MILTLIRFFEHVEHASFRQHCPSDCESVFDVSGVWKEIPAYEGQADIEM